VLGWIDGAQPAGGVFVELQYSRFQVDCDFRLSALLSATIGPGASGDKKVDWAFSHRSRFMVEAELRPIAASGPYDQ